jgi:hypothetical protein
MRHLGLNRGYDIDFNPLHRSYDVYLYLGNKDNRVLISGTTALSRQAAILNAIDEYGVWGSKIDIWLTSERRGKQREKTPHRSFKTHVKPYYGKLKILDMIQDINLRKTYAGIGIGRTLSRSINGRYYFRNGSTLETRDRFRGFDCTTFPLTLFSIKNFPPHGYELHSAVLAGICKHGIKRVTTNELRNSLLENNLQDGVYIIFSEGHILLYDSYYGMNMFFEWNKGGLIITPAYEKKLRSKHNKWLIGELPDKCRQCFPS